jgi:iron complex outermembrane receptor protein
VRILFFTSSVLLWLSSFAAFSQNKDTTRILNEVTVQAYNSNRSLQQVPASIAVVGPKDFNRFSPASILPGFNMQPGVRVEERSPGSYRFSIRGSTLRSPFGVRNVKFYWNGLPLTDGGGNTYLNLLDLQAISEAEVIKGPGGSLYGAGTGGVVLMRSGLSDNRQAQASAMGGSYGLQRYQASVNTSFRNSRIYFNYAHQQSDGYRQQSAMKRDAFNLESKTQLSSQNTLRFTSFFTNLNYQTPGALTSSQYYTDAHLANPTAVSKKAYIENKTIYTALNDDHQWNSKWSSRIGFYYSYTDFTNPTVSNYERRLETNWGGRTDTQYEFAGKLKGKLTMGAEFQNFYSPLTDYDNNGGARGAVQTDDQLKSTLLIGFLQSDFELPNQFFVTAGLSSSFLNYQFTRLAGPSTGDQQRNFDPVLSPRLAVLKKINSQVSVFASMSRGFSPPSLAEVRPSTGVYNNTLAPEIGMNYEAGVKTVNVKNFSIDVTAYDFELDQAIVSQKQGVQDYFVNAGKTSQKGIEFFLAWQKKLNGPFNHFKVWASAALTNYTFANYVRDGVNYSGNWLTGTPGKTLAGGVDFSLLQHFYMTSTLSFVDRIPLNDVNSVYASDYLLVGSRIGYKANVNATNQLELFAGIDNALDQRYSLGNDLNSSVGRFFNAAAPRNFYFGVRFIFSQANP